LPIKIKNLRRWRNQLVNLPTPPGDKSALPLLIPPNRSDPALD
jgi:hypothetical protein